MGASTSHNPIGLPDLTGIALLLPYMWMLFAHMEYSYSWMGYFQFIQLSNVPPHKGEIFKEFLSGTEPFTFPRLISKLFMDFYRTLHKYNFNIVIYLNVSKLFKLETMP
jgi:hypothetical protein